RERAADRDRPGQSLAGPDNPDRVGPELSRARRPAPAPELGQHGRRRAAVPGLGLVDRDLPRARHLRHGAGIQPVRRRAARRIGSDVARAHAVTHGGPTVIHPILIALLATCIGLTPSASLAGFPELTAKENPKRPEELAVRPIEVIDDHTVRFRLRYPSGSFLAVLVNPRAGIVPEHILKGTDLNTAEFNRRPIGTGPFRLV